MLFVCKKLDNIINGPQRTVKNEKQRQFKTPLKRLVSLSNDEQYFYNTS